MRLSGKLPQVIQVGMVPDAKMKQEFKERVKNNTITMPAEKR